MTPDRVEAYARVMKTLADLGPSKLHSHEQAVIRTAADDLLLFEALPGEDPRMSALEVEWLAARLVEAERWGEHEARRLVEDVLACGPLALAR
ncbi:MAG TPA: hypothetical protein VEQ61_11360 [Thermoleophilaceae bacterium]|nr:hypothetical protein [Thermoleophilaceae bacterium]